MFNVHMYKQDLVLNNLQELTCYKTQLTSPKRIYIYIIIFTQPLRSGRI